ncbi:MAG: hypothetical protein IPN29_11460 [Saprospiraceae bacterium]|nr:hypothetical protein [Saprospiraceae bacterium]
MKNYFFIVLISFWALETSSQIEVVSAGTTHTGTYASLAEAFEAINLGIHTDSVIIQVTSNVNETDTARLDASGTGSTSYQYISIEPVAGSWTVSANIDGPLVELNGADHVNINGTISTGIGLSFINNNTGPNSCTIKLHHDATNNLIQNCTIHGASVNAAEGSGVIYFGEGQITGNDHNTIDNCQISSDGVNMPLNAIYSKGSSFLIDNSEITISNNLISNFFNSSFSSSGLNINSHNHQWNISGNSFFQTGTRVASSGNHHYAIFIANNGNDYHIANNYIGGQAANCGGAGPWTLSGSVASRFVGIGVSLIPSSLVNIHGNTIANFNITTTSSANTANGNFSGIWVSEGNANIGTLSGNIIGSGTGNGSITVTLQNNSGGTANLIAYSGTGNVNINNNTVGSINLLGASSSTSMGIQAIWIGGGIPAVIGNSIGSITTSNSINCATAATSSTAQRVSAIVVTGIITNADIVISQNTISNIFQAGTGSTHYLRAISFSGQGVTNANNVVLEQNTIKNLTAVNANPTLSSGNLSLVGILLLGTTSPFSVPIIRENVIQNLFASNAGSVQTNVAGVAVSNCAPGGNISSNKIHNLRSASSSPSVSNPPTVSGIYLRAMNSGTVLISNNMINLGTDQSSNTQFMGIWNGFTAANVNILNNTINIEGMVSAGVLPTFCFLRGDNSAASAIISNVKLKNNIFNNSRSGGTGNHFCIGNNYGNVSSSGLGWEGGASNYNVLNSFQTSTIGYWNVACNFNSWKLASSGDNFSVQGEPVNFIDPSLGNLHLDAGLNPTPIESGGIPIPEVVIDIDNQQRPGPAASVNGGAISHDIGADEFDGVRKDIFGPIFCFRPFINTTCTENRNLACHISDLSQINVAAGTKPRLYFKLSSHNNTFINNTSTSNCWKYVEASNSTSPFTFIVNYSLLFGGGGVSPGNTIQYFFVAQDLFSIPNVGLSNGVFNSQPASVNLTASAFPITGSIKSYSIVTGLPTYITIGVGGNYETLTGTGGLFEAINNNGLAGNTTVTIQDEIVIENGLKELMNMLSGNCTASTYSLTIKPDAGLETTLTGANNSGPLLRILASNVTIDGSNSGTSSKNLKLINSASSALLFGSADTSFISNSKIINCFVQSGPSSSSGIILSNAGTIGSPGYFRDIIIENNSIESTSVGINCNGFSGQGKRLLIKDNAMNTADTNEIRNVGIYLQGIDSSTVTGNQLGNFESVNPENDRAIWLASGTKNTIVSQNSISGLNFSGATPNNPTGIYINTGISNSNIVVSNNQISGISSGGITNTSSGRPSGIVVSGSTSGIKIFGNKVSDITNSATEGYGASGIELGSSSLSANISVYNNFVSDVSAFGSPGASENHNGNGMVVLSGAGYRIYFNTICLHQNQGSNLGNPSALLVTSGVNISGAADIRNNIFSNKQTNGGERYAIYSQAPPSVFSQLDYNNYYSTGDNLGFIILKRSTLADIRTGFGGNLNSQQVEPEFIAPPTDLHLIPANSTTLSGAGISIPQVNTDIDNQVRDNYYPDIGADEFYLPCSSLVTNNANAGIGTLRFNISCLEEGDTITFDQPSITQSLLTTPLNIHKNVTIKGLSFQFKPEISIDFTHIGTNTGLILSNGKTLTLNDVDVKAVNNGPGGTLIENNGTLKVTGSTILSNL